MNRPLFNLSDEFGWSNVDKYNLDWLIQRQIDTDKTLKEFKERVNEYVEYLEEKASMYFPDGFKAIRVNPNLPIEVVRFNGRYIEITYNVTEEPTNELVEIIKIVDEDKNQKEPVIRPVVIFKENKSIDYLSGFVKYEGKSIKLGLRRNYGASNYTGVYTIVIQL